MIAKYVMPEMIPTLKPQLASFEKKLKDLKICHGLGDIDKETYDLTSEHLSRQIQAVHKELNTVAPKCLTSKNCFRNH